MYVYFQNIHGDYERVESGKRVRDCARGREGGKESERLERE